ncbi:MAG: hypothetical protein QM490_03815 [Candidatus Gracilibacteria bacterium]
MEEKNNEINNNIDSKNIFDEFADDSNLVEEVDKLKDENNKDLFFYISKTGAVLQTVFWLGLILTIIIFTYIHYQNDEELKNSNILDPFCSIFLGDVKNEDSYCSSISSLKKTYEKKIDLLQKGQATDILGILERLYEVENFLKSKEVIFLVDNTKNKLSVLSIIEEFDDIKNEFNIEKDKIECQFLVIDTKDNLLSMSCESYSQGYEKGLRGFDGTTDNTLKGTSLSQANSFLNFIEKTSTFFEIADKQKMFKEEPVLGNKTGLTSKTQFDLKLKYNLIK